MKMRLYMITFAALLLLSCVRLPEADCETTGYGERMVPLSIAAEEIRVAVQTRGMGGATMDSILKYGFRCSCAEGCCSGDSYGYSLFFENEIFTYDASDGRFHPSSELFYPASGDESGHDRVLVFGAVYPPSAEICTSVRSQGLEMSVRVGAPGGTCGDVLAAGVAGSVEDFISNGPELRFNHILSRISLMVKAPDGVLSYRVKRLSVSARWSGEYCLYSGSGWPLSVTASPLRVDAPSERMILDSAEGVLISGSGTMLTDGWQTLMSSVLPYEAYIELEWECSNGVLSNSYSGRALLSSSSLCPFRAGESYNYLINVSGTVMSPPVVILASSDSETDDRTIFF